MPSALITKVCGPLRRTYSFRVPGLVGAAGLHRDRSGLLKANATGYRLAKFKRRPNHTFHLHLKETEWRYNHRRPNKYQTLL